MPIGNVHIGGQLRRLTNTATLECMPNWTELVRARSGAQFHEISLQWSSGFICPRKPKKVSTSVSPLCVWRIPLLLILKLKGLEFCDFRKAISKFYEGPVTVLGLGFGITRKSCGAGIRNLDNPRTIPSSKWPLRGPRTKSWPCSRERSRRCPQKLKLLSKRKKKP